jgi:hypothetical protein
VLILKLAAVPTTGKRVKPAITAIDLTILVLISFLPKNRPLYLTCMYPQLYALILYPSQINDKKLSELKKTTHYVNRRL